MFMDSISVLLVFAESHLALTARGRRGAPHILFIKRLVTAWFISTNSLRLPLKRPTDLIRKKRLQIYCEYFGTKLKRETCKFLFYGDSSFSRAFYILICN